MRLIILLISLALCACSGHSSKTMLASWNETSKTCGNDTEIDSIVLACLNSETSRKIKSGPQLEAYLFECINESFMYRPSLAYDFELLSTNDFMFQYENGGTCENSYNR